MVVDNKTSTTNNLHLPPFTTFQPLNTTVPYSPTVSLALSFSRNDQRRRHCSSEVLRRSFFAAIGRSLRQRSSNLPPYAKRDDNIEKTDPRTKDVVETPRSLASAKPLPHASASNVRYYSRRQPLAHRAGDNR